MSPTPPPAPGLTHHATSSRFDRRDWTGLVIAAATLAAVFGVAASRRPFYWYDELITQLEVADRSFAHMVQVIARGLENNPPLYQILLRGWSSVVGQSPAALRALSTVCVVGSMAVMWRAMRQQLSTPAVAVALALTFFRADAILDQVAQARQYALFLLTASLAIATALELLRRERVGASLWIATFLAHCLLLYTHTFGILYSVAIGVAIVAVDGARRRFRPTVVLAIGAAWLAFAPWLPHMLVQGRMTEPRMWIARPGFSRLTGVLTRLTSPISFAVLGAAALAWWPRRRGVFAADGRVAFLAVGLAVAAVAPAVFVESRIGRPIFVDRYVIASALGFPLLVGVALDALFRRVPARTAVRIGGLAYFALAAGAVVRVARREIQRPPRLEVPASLARVPAIAESALDFMPLRAYGGGTRAHRFALDWELAVDAGNAPAAVQDYKLMELAAREGYLGGDVVDGDRWLAAVDTFLVIDTKEHLWFERRVRGDSAWRTTEVGRYGPAALVWLVERRIATKRRNPTTRQSTP